MISCSPSAARSVHASISIILFHLLHNISKIIWMQQQHGASCTGNADSLPTRQHHRCTDSRCLENHSAGCSIHCTAINKAGCMWRRTNNAAILPHLWVVGVDGHENEWSELSIQHLQAGLRTRSQCGIDSEAKRQIKAGWSCINVLSSSRGRTSSKQLSDACFSP